MDVSDPCAAEEVDEVFIELMKRTLCNSVKDEWVVCVKCCGQGLIVGELVPSFTVANGPYAQFQYSGWGTTTRFITV